MIRLGSVKYRRGEHSKCLTNLHPQVPEIYQIVPVLNVGSGHHKLLLLSGLLAVVGVPQEPHHGLDKPEDGVVSGLGPPRVLLKNQEAEDTEIAVKCEHLKSNFINSIQFVTSCSNLSIVFDRGKCIHDEFQEVVENVSLLHNLVLEHHQVHEDVADGSHGVLGVDHLELRIVNNVKGFSDICIVLCLCLIKII